MESKNGLGWKDFKDSPVPNPCHGQRHFPLDQAAHSSIQPGLNSIKSQPVVPKLPASLENSSVPRCWKEWKHDGEGAPCLWQSPDAQAGCKDIKCS